MAGAASQGEAPAIGDALALTGRARVGRAGTPLLSLKDSSHSCAMPRTTTFPKSFFLMSPGHHQTGIIAFAWEAAVRRWNNAGESLLSCIYLRPTLEQ